MVALIMAGIAVLLYIGTVNVSAPLTIGAAVGLSLVMLLLSLVGLVVGHRAPELASALLGAWTVFIITLGGAVTALLAYLAVVQAAGDDASTQEKTLAALLLSLLVLAIEQTTSLVSNHLSQWWARFAICGRYTSLFPALPASKGPGYDAYDALLQCYSGDDGWRRNGRESTLVKIRKALEAGEYKGGENWTVPQQT